MEKKYSRKDFLLNTSKAAVGVTAVAGLTSLITTATTRANNTVTPWPWPYQELNQDETRIEAHYLYWNDKDCASGVFGGLINKLAAAIGEPWSSLPMEILLFGRGGGVGWGSICGVLNGAAAIISLVTDKPSSAPLITELWGWYTQVELPTDTANNFATNGQYLVHNYDDALPQNISGSPLCHVSVTEWCVMADKKVSDIERKERCARIAGDCAAKTTEILNDYFAGTFVPTYVDPATVTACLGCHGSAALNNVMTKMECTACHGDPHAPSSVEPIGGNPKAYRLEQNFPNPFNPSTTIRFSIPEPQRVNLEVYDISGSKVRSLISAQQYQSGNYQIKWDGKDDYGNKVVSGIYFARLDAGRYMQSIKMNLLK